MRDILITVHKNHTVDFENDYAGLNKENLQGNITFKFDEFVSGQARAEIVINNQDGYILLDQVGQTYTLPIKSSLLTGDSILMQLVIDEDAKYKKTDDTTIQTGKTYYEKVGNEYVVVVDPQVEDIHNYYEAEIPVWKSEVFYLKVGCSINATATIPEEYDSWIEVLNGLITQGENVISEAGNVNITSEQLDDGVKVITTNRNGEQTITIVPQGPQGEKGEPGAIKMLIVAELPETGADDTIYLVPITPDTSGNNYAEYVYISGQWELLGKIGVQVDLTNYVQFTDFATEQKAGVVKVISDFGIQAYNGYLSALVKTYAQYQSMQNYGIIGKGTLENVITGKGLVSNTNYATADNSGVVKTGYGLLLNSGGKTYADIKTYDQFISSSVSDNLFVSKGTLNNVLTATIGDISSVIDAINNEVI